MIRLGWMSDALAKTAKTIFEFVAIEGRNASLDEIAELEGVSRQAIWFKVKKLKNQGFIPDFKSHRKDHGKSLELTKIGREYVLEFEYLEEPVNA